MRYRTIGEVRALLREKCREAGSTEAWAAQKGINGSYVRHALSGRATIGPKIMAALGLKEVRVFVEERNHG